MIEDNISDLEKRVDEIETKFSKLVSTLSSGFGSNIACELEGRKVQVQMLENQLATYRHGNQEKNELLIKLARILKVKTITSDALIKAAKKVAGATGE